MHKSLKFYATGLLILSMLTGGYLLHESRLEAARAVAREQMQGVANLKSQQISHWRSGRYSDGELLRNNSLLVDQVLNWFVRDTHQMFPVESRDYLIALHLHYGYRAAVIVDAEGAIRFSLGDGLSGVLDGMEQTALREAWQTRETLLTDIGMSPGLDYPHLSVIVPLFRGQMPAGAILLVVDAREALFPLIQSWPTPSESGESLIVRRDGDSILLVSEPRLQSGVALKLKFPLTRTDLPPVQAIMGKTGLIEGHDYRGVPVGAIIVPISDTPWLLITKMDSEEIYAASRREALFYSVIWLSGVLIFLGLGIMVWYRSRQTQVQKLLQTETDLKVSEERFHSLFEEMPDPAWIIYKNRFVEANRAALKAIGCENRRDFMTLHPAEVSPDFQPDGQSSFAKAERIMADMRTRSHMQFEWVHKRRNGSHFPVEVTLTRIEWEGEPALYCIWRDISDRQRVQEDLVSSQARLKAIFESTHDAILLMSRGYFIDCNPRALELFGVASKEALLSLHPLDLSPPRQQDGRLSQELAEANQQQALEQGYCVFEWLHRRQDGGEFLTQVRLCRIPLGDQSMLQATVTPLVGRERA